MPSQNLLFPSLPRGAPGFPIGRFAGAPITVRWEALVTLPLFSLGALRNGGWPLAATVFAAMVFSILAHELAHAAVARRRNARILAVQVTAFGGLCWFDDEGLGRRDLRAIYAAGPLANLGLAAALVSVALLRATPETAPQGLLDATLSAAVVMNVAFGLFNLLPAFPLDGGLIALSTLEPRIGRTRTLLLVSGFGMLAAVPIYLAGLALLLLGSPFILMLTFRRNRLVFHEAWADWRVEARTRRETADRERSTLADCDAALAAIVARSARERKRP